MDDLFAPLLKEKRKLVYLIVPVILLTLYLVQPMVPSAPARKAMAIAFGWLVLISTGYVVVRIARGWVRELKFNRRNHRAMAITAGAIFLVGLVGLIWFFTQEQDIKTYDTAMYWHAVLTDRVMMEASIPEFMVYLVESFATRQNHLASFLLVPLSYITGVQYVGFVTSIFLLYYLPACFMLALFGVRLVRRMRGDSKPSVIVFNISMLLCVTTVSFFWPMMSGYLDVVAVLAMGLLLNRTLDWDPSVLNLKDDLGIAALSLLAIISNYWFSYYVIGFYIGYLAYLLLEMIPARRFRWEALRGYGYNLIAIAVFMTFGMLSINYRMIGFLFGGDFGTSRAAYTGLSLLGNLWQGIQTLGIFWVLASVAGAMLFIFNRYTWTTALRLFISTMTGVVIFHVTQSMGWQHYFLLLPLLMIYLCGVVEYAVKYMRNEEKPILLLSLASIAIANIVFSFVPGVQELASSVRPFVSSMYIEPAWLEEYDIIRQLVAQLDEDVGEGTGKVYVVGDSKQLSPEILRRCYMPEVINAAPYVLDNNTIDLRDGFPSQAFLADYIMLTDPVQRDFGSHRLQAVTTQMHDMMLEDPIASHYYELLTRYKGTNYNYLLYKKRTHTKLEMVDQFRERMRRYYPIDPFVNTPNYFLALAQISGGTPYELDYEHGTLTFNKDTQTALKIDYDVEGAGFTQLKLALRATSDDVQMFVNDENGLFETVTLSEENTVYTFDIAGKNWINLTFQHYDDTPPGVSDVTITYDADSLI